AAAHRARHRIHNGKIGRSRQRRPNHLQADTASILLYTIMLVFEDVKSIVTGEVNHGNAALS
ncbi:MAG: hypothetical protein LBT65_03790, partial [Synergistaceae bacterium]|nr:hypothetical protein [Synergistaceae bacterium]